MRKSFVCILLEENWLSVDSTGERIHGQMFVYIAIRSLHAQLIQVLSNENNYVFKILIRAECFHRVSYMYTINCCSVFEEILTSMDERTNERLSERANGRRKIIFFAWPLLAAAAAVATAAAIISSSIELSARVIEVLTG